MEWEVEDTEAFGEWWGSLTEAEQEDVAAVVELLEEKGPKLPTPIVQESTPQSIRTCENCESNTPVDPTGLSRLDGEPLRLAVENARAQLSVARAKVVETKQVYERTAGLVVTFPTLPDASVGGVVSEISSRTQAGNAFPVTVRLSPTEVDLRSGMTASVTFNFDQYLDGQPIYLIPLSALAIEAGSLRNAGQADTASRKAPVFVVGADGKLELRDLRVGDLRGNLLEVFEGLEAGERIVSAGVALLREGMRVELWSPEQGLTDG